MGPGFDVLVLICSPLLVRQNNGYKKVSPYLTSSRPSLQCCGEVARNCFHVSRGSGITNNRANQSNAPVILPADLSGLLDLERRNAPPATVQPDRLAQTTLTDEVWSAAQKPAFCGTGADAENVNPSPLSSFPGSPSASRLSSKASPAAEAVRNLCKRLTWKR